MVRDIEVKITTSSGLLDVSADVEALDFDRTSALKAGSFRLRLLNDGSYDGKFSRYNPITIRVAATPGGALRDMFAGRLDEWENVRPRLGGKKRIVDVQGFDYFMDTQMVTHSGVFKSQTAGAIISNLLQSYCPDIDRTNIDAGPTLTYIGGQDKKVSDFIEEILSQPECDGWMFWIDYKKAHFKNMGSAFSSLQLNDQNVLEPQVKKLEDLYANRIKVYGAKNQIHPATLDDYTENDAANWTKSNITLTDDSAEKKVGSYSLKLTHTKSTNRYIRRAFTAAQNLNILKTLNFWLRQDTVQNVMVKLLTDASNYYYRNSPLGAVNMWEQKSFQVGADSLGWTASGSPSWANIASIEFYWPSTDTTTGTTYLDKLHLLGGPIIKVAEDWSQILQFGIREHEPIVDESITDPQFAEKLAQTWLADLGTTKTEIGCRQTYSDIDLGKVEIGKLVTVEIVNENISGTFVLREAKFHFVPHTGLEAEYLLGDPPSPYALQIKGMMRELERLKRRGTDPETNFDVWNRFYAEAPAISAEVRWPYDLSQFSADLLPRSFPYDFPFYFSNTLVSSLTITES